MYVALIIIRIVHVIGLGDATVFWDFNAIDDFYKTDMPDWPFNDGVDKPTPC